MMFRGIDQHTIDRLLQDQFFKDSKIVSDNYITRNTIRNDVDQAVIDFLDAQGYKWEEEFVEYWFQWFGDGCERVELFPHVDFNEKIREKYRVQDAQTNIDFSKKHLMSPITIAAYLDVSEDMVGGELCISSYDWFDSNPFQPDLNYIKEQPYTTFKPKTHDVLYFNGSRYYHWVNPVERGSRKSVQINFWTQDHLPPSS